MMRYARGLWSAVLSSLVMVSPGTILPAWACTVCWGGNATQGWAFAVSSYVLLGTPFLLVGIIVTGALLIQKRMQQQRRTRRTTECVQISTKAHS